VLAIIRVIYISKQQLYNNYTWIIKISFLAVIFIGPLSHTIGPLRGCGPLALGNFYYILYYMERAQFLMGILCISATRCDLTISINKDLNPHSNALIPTINTKMYVKYEMLIIFSRIWWCKENIYCTINWTHQNFFK
jgi:hypothetical protein